LGDLALRPFGLLAEPELWRISGSTTESFLLMEPWLLLEWVHKIEGCFVEQVTCKALEDEIYLGLFSEMLLVPSFL